MKLLRKEFVFDACPPTPECHASTLVYLTDGRILAAWFGGTKESADDVAIWVSRRENDGWTAPVCVSRELGIPHWNPVLFQWDHETVALFYKVGFTIPAWKTMVTYSYDGGKSWTKPCELVAGDETGGRGPVKNKAIRTQSGRILAPAREKLIAQRYPAHGALLWMCTVRMDGRSIRSRFHRPMM